MEDCMINEPESMWPADEYEEDPLDAYTDEEISLFMSDPGPQEARQ